MPYKFNPLPPRFDRVDGGSVAPDIETLTGNSGGAVGPDGAFNINILGSGNIDVTGNPGTNTLTISQTGGTDIETLTGDTGGAVGPDGAGNIDFLTTVSSDFNLSEIQTVGVPASNRITLTQYNTLTGFTANFGPATVNVITFDLGATAAAYIFDVRFIGYDTVNNVACGYNIFATMRTDGASASLVGVQDKIINEEGALIAGDLNVVATGNNFQLQYDVPAGSTVEMTCYTKYTKQEA